MAGFDTPQHYLGWQFFRNAPWWQWPMGSNPGYGSDAPGTIVLTDSIPLLAFAFKFFNRLLPPDFQYLGFWILCCFELQAWFGYKLMARLTSDSLLRLLGCAMFLAAPIFLMRLYLHPALGGQWILLAALYLSLDSRLRGRAWFVLLVIASLVHAYLLVMAGALWLATRAGNLIYRSDPPWKIFRQILIILLAVVCTMWVVGYFVASAIEPAQFISHTNLLTFVLNGPCEYSTWSRLVPCISISKEAQIKTGDGFGYFGLGFLLLVPLALALRLWHGRLASAPISSSSWRPLLLCCVALLIFAVGSTVYIGSYLLLSFDIPRPLDRLWSTFRGAARMEWPLWYLLLLICLGVVVTRLGRNRAAVVLLVLLVAQYADLSKSVVSHNAASSKPPPFQDQLKTAIWSDLAARYRHLAYFPAPGASLYLLTWIPTYRQLAHYAALNNMTINVGYLARMDLVRLAAARAARSALLEKGLAEPSTFYVIEDAELWPRVLCAPDNGQWHGHIGGLPVLIPNTQGIAGLTSADVCQGSPTVLKG